ncbi:hypothetical protein SNE40_021023 [Patella caerulea]|uniref:Y+L amino acid transporter 2 n=1 Tax=Patella caerulea TaxID=87958 RepID=A0AAN8G1F2_PATCE
MAIADKAGTSGDAPRVQLRKQITLFHCVSIIVGIIIGSGIFVSPVGILQNVQSVGMSLLLWTVCGIFSTLCAICFAELGACIPESGGEYMYIKRAFGDFLSFICLWINLVIIQPVGTAASTLIFATYILRPVYPDCEPPKVAIRLIGVCVYAFLTAINVFNVKWATKVQAIITASKLSALIMVIVIGLIWIVQGNTINFQNPFANSDYSAGSVAIAFYSGFWAFGGWNYLNFLADEVIEPNRNLPSAILISMAIVTVVYLVANVAYFAVLTPQEMLLSSAVAVTFAEQTVRPVVWIMPILIAISVMGSMNGSMLSMSRLFFVGSRHNHLPEVISMISVRFSTPAPSLIVMCILTITMQNFEEIFYLIEMMGFGFATVLTTTLAALIHLRWKEPDLKRPIKLPVVLPILLFFISISILVLTVYQKPQQSGLAILIIACGIPLYLFGTWRSKPASIQNILVKITEFIQKLMYVAAEDDENSKTLNNDDVTKLLTENSPD